MEDDLRDDGQGHEHDAGPLFQDVPGDSSKKPGKRDLPGHRSIRSEEANKWNRQADNKLDIIESRDGMMIFGQTNWHPEDKKSILVLFGFNDSTILDMGRLGLLKGKAMEIYEKLRR